MNILFLVLQVVLALHTIMGALWKFTNAEQAVPALNAIPHGVWLGMSVVELVCALFLILPMIKKSLGILAPIGAAGVALEMLFMSAVLIVSGDGNFGPMIYWLVVAAFCGFIIYGRLVLKPV